MALAHPLASRCPATSKRSGQRCQNRVIGGGPCRLHGGAAPQVRAAREARIAAAESLQSAPHSTRDAGEILVGTMQDGDTIYRHLFQQVKNGTATAADAVAMGTWLDRTNRLAKTVHDARIEERQMQLNEDTARVFVAAIKASFAAMLGEVGDILDDEEMFRRVQAIWPRASNDIVRRELAALRGSRSLDV